MPDIVKVEYKQTGESTRTNPYGMHEMQSHSTVATHRSGNVA